MYLMSTVHFKMSDLGSSLMEQRVNDLMLLLQWLRLLLWVPSLAWELPHAVGAAKKEKGGADFVLCIFFFYHNKKRSVPEQRWSKENLIVPRVITAETLFSYPFIQQILSSSCVSYTF